MTVPKFGLERYSISLAPNWRPRVLAQIVAVSHVCPLVGVERMQEATTLSLAQTWQRHSRLQWLGVSTMWQLLINQAAVCGARCYVPVLHVCFSLS